MKTHLLLCCVLCLALPTLAQDSKLKPEELIAKHLEALGTAEARATAGSRMVAGTVSLTSRLGSAGNLQGQTMMASLGPKFRFGTRFNSPSYPGDDMAFNGKRTMTGFLLEGKRSNLILFLNSQEMILRDGLIGGVLSTAWPLLRLDQLKAPVNYRGLKKVDGVQMHEMIYRPPKGSGDLRVAMYFDAETFRHLRTQYDYEIGARLGLGPNESARQQESRYQLIETFEDFRVVDGLTLPHKLKMQLSIQTQASSLLTDWLFAFTRFSHKQKIEDDVFEIK
ncbi:MAG TPA: hypothetical protein VFZ34_03595 [Blastocatellia bacterium]|nr:hypothetical protein [Blastocatellia bacterium]